MSSRLITPSRPSSKKVTIGFVNLGCSKNQVDSEVMLGTLVADGFALTADPKEAEVVIINTCGFIEEAKQESIDTIIAHGKLKETGACRVLIAAGCLAQRYQGDLLKQLPELDGGVGTGEFGRSRRFAGTCWCRKNGSSDSGSASPPICMTQTPRVSVWGRPIVPM